MIPLVALTGLGDLSGKSLFGLATTGSGLDVADWGEIDFRSNILTRDVVGAIGDESVGLSPIARSELLVYEDSLRGFGGTAGVLVVAIRVPSFLLLVLGFADGAGPRAVAREAAC